MSKNATLYAMYTAAMETAVVSDNGYPQIEGPVIEEIFLFGITEYPTPSASDVSVMFKDQMNGSKGWAKGMLTLDFLNSLPEAVVPLAVVRHLFAFDIVTMRPNDIPSWRRFMDKYQRLVLDA